MLSFRKVFGGDVDEALRPVLASVGLGALGQFAFFAFFAVWAVGERGAEATSVGLAYTCAGVAAAAGALLGGRVSDRIGRQPVVVAASVAQTLAPILLLLPAVPLVAAYAVLVTMGFSQPVRGTAQRALLADLVAEDAREQAYGAFRVVLNLGATFGPLVGAALVAWRWDALFAAIVVAYALSFAAAVRLPKSARRTPPGGPAASIRPLLRSSAFLIVFLATLGGWFAYNAFELLAPISLTQTHGVDPAIWGLLFAINPIVIVVLQMRLTRWTARTRRDARLAAGVLLMASPYLALEISAGIPVVAAVVLVVVIGEMLWAPTSETLVANMAPPGLRGIYLGTATAASWMGLALAPAVGLQARALFGDAGMWVLVAAAGAAGAGLYLVACRQAESARDRPPLRYRDDTEPGDARRDRGRRGRRRAEARGPDGQPARAARG